MFLSIQNAWLLSVSRGDSRFPHTLYLRAHKTPSGSAGIEDKTALPEQHPEHPEKLPATEYTVRQVLIAVSR